MNFNHFFIVIIFFCAALNGMQNISGEDTRRAAIAFHYIPVNDTNSVIQFTGMTGIKPRRGEERPWCFESFKSKTQKPEHHFLHTEVACVETETAKFEIRCPQELVSTVVAFGVLKKTQEEIEAKTFRLLRDGKSKLRIVVNESSIEFEDITNECKPFEYTPRTGFSLQL